jgi:hypothetical protein
MRSKLSLLFLGILFLTILFIPRAETKVKSYYSGDAIMHRGQLIIGSTNTSSLEVFGLVGDKLVLLNKIKPINEKFGTYDKFYDFSFKTEENNLFVYASSGNYLYKYNATDLSNIFLVKKVKDNSWDWFGRVGAFKDKVVTFGTKGVKIWTSDLDVIDSFKVINVTNPYNIVFSDNYKFIFNINDKNLEIFDQEVRTTIKTIILNYSTQNGNRRLYNDSANSFLYALDDQALKKYNFSGDLLKSFENKTGFSYDVIPSTDEQSLYLSNGKNITKLNKDDFSVLSAFSNSSLGDLGGWAMGMDLVGNDDYLVVFNSTNILVLNKELDKIAVFKSQEESQEPELVLEKLFLNIDKTRAATGSSVSLVGGGYAKNEKVSIDFIGQKTEATTDEKGRFSVILTVPSTQAQRGDIKVVGQQSKLNYSIAFEIE